MNTINSDQIQVEYNKRLFTANIKKYLIKQSNILIVDENIYKIYQQELKKIKNINEIFLFQATEKNKNLLIVNKIVNFLIKNKCQRDSCIIALGGGITGDISGFVAAIYMRGIDYIQIPTTLLAQVDAAIGGKTAVNFDKYKNMLGRIYAPKFIYINSYFLHSLPKRHFIAGLAEVIKISLINNQDFFNFLIRNFEQIINKNTKLLNKVICIAANEKALLIKQDINEEYGIRLLLNFGHSFGHVIEILTNYEILHGEAVIIGMIIAVKISVLTENLQEKTGEYLISFLNEIYYNSNISLLLENNANSLLDLVFMDKKNKNGKINFIILTDIGKAKNIFLTKEKMKNLICKIF